jgi:hypothetical protein
MCACVLAWHSLATLFFVHASAWESIQIGKTIGEKTKTDSIGTLLYFPHQLKNWLCVATQSVWVVRPGALSLGGPTFFFLPFFSFIVLFLSRVDGWLAA